MADQENHDADEQEGTGVPFSAEYVEENGVHMVELQLKDAVVRVTIEHAFLISELIADVASRPSLNLDFDGPDMY